MPKPPNSSRLLKDLLRGVSRSFYLTLRALPPGMRTPTGTAYLLARAADTIADTRAVPPAQRLQHLLALRGHVDGSRNVAQRAEDLQAIAASLTDLQSHAKERELLRMLPEVFALLETLPADDQKSARDIVVTLTQGMEFDLKTFPSEDSGEIRALKTPAELDRYTYLVAGCVGAFWTELSIRHAPALAHWDKQAMSETGIRFGKALQFTNILRDVPGDLRIGRCYLPLEWLAPTGLEPRELLQSGNAAKARPAVQAGLKVALEHYAEAEKYILAIPRRCVRLRLAALWPVLIGLATLAHLSRNDAWLEPEKASKVTRGWVYRMMLGSFFCVASNTLLKNWIGGWRRQIKTS